VEDRSKERPVRARFGCPTSIRSMIVRMSPRRVRRSLWTLALTLAVFAASASTASASDIVEVNPPLQTLTEEQVSRLSPHLGALSLHLVVGYASDPASVPRADSITLNRENGDVSLHGPVCQVAVNHTWWGARTHYEMEEVLVHEVFHCYEHQIAPAMTRFNEAGGAVKNEGEWIIEGLAKWVDLTFFPLVAPAGFEDGIKSLTEYYKTPSRSLFARAYDAVGFWAHVQDVSGDLWNRIPDILRAGQDEHNQPAADAALPGAEEEDFLSSWGSSAFDLPGEEIPTWLPQSPLGGRYWPEGGSPPTPQTVDGSAGVVLAPYSTAQLKIVPRADKPLIQISLDPGAYARFGVSENYTGKSLTDKTFCAEEECHSPPAECPAGTVSKVPPTTPLPEQPDLGVAAGRMSSTVQIHYFSAQNSGLCEEPPPPPGSGSGGSGGGGPGSGDSTASSFGDPHLIGFGSTEFEFQAAGEFTMLKSTTAHDLEIQARQQPEDGLMSVDTAVAVRDGHAVVEVDRPLPSALTGAGQLSVLVNHHLTHSSHVKLSGGGVMERVSLRNAGFGGNTKYPGVKIRWPDGTYIEIPENYVGISLLVRVAPARLDHLTGLLGDAGAPAATRFRGREGKDYPPLTLENDEYAVYRKYGASWRISQHESLFTYAHHKSTHSYTQLNFPSKHYSDGLVELAKALHAEAECREAGSTNLALLQACEYDVLLTGKSGYAGGDGLVQRVSQPGPPRGVPVGSLPIFVGGGSPTSSSGGSPAPSGPTPPAAIDLGAGGALPSVAYDSSHGDTYVAWQDPANQAVIDLCVVPDGANVCNGGSGPYKLTDPLAGGGAIFFGSKVLVMPSGTVVVVANLQGAGPSVRPMGYASEAGVIAWSSPAGGEAFGKPGQGIANEGGKLLAEGKGEMPDQGALALGLTNILVYGNEQHPFGSGATDFTLMSKAHKTTPEVNQTGEFGDQESTDGSQLAAEEYPASSGKYVVVTAGTDLGTAPGCGAQEKASGYGFAEGTTTELQGQGAWHSEYFKLLTCQAEEVVLTGGGPGHAAIGAVQSEGSGLNGVGADGVSYVPFNIATDTFGVPVQISEEAPFTLLGVDELSASEDSAGGLYACWTDGRGVMLAHSTDGGASWGAPSITNIEGAGNVVVAGTSPGEASIAYAANPSGSNPQEYLAPSL
jgi:hypothetical protein